MVQLRGDQIKNESISGDQLLDDSVTTDDIADNTIMNVDINSAAGIIYSKLSVADGDITIAKINTLQTALDSKTNADGSSPPTNLILEGVEEVRLRTNSTTRLTASSAGIDVNSLKILNVATPTIGTDAVNKAYADSISAGLDPKASVRVATTAALPANTASGTGPTHILTADAVGILTVDGIVTVLGDRILVKDESAGTDLDHGIYEVTTEGTAGVAFVLTRASDFDDSPSNEVDGGEFCFIEEGTTNAEYGFVMITDDPILDTTPIEFALFAGAGNFTAGDHLTATGGALNVDDDFVLNTGDTLDGNYDITGTLSIGIVSGDGTLHIHTATAGAITAHVDADDLVIENNERGGISIITPANKYGQVVFADPGSNLRGYLRYTHSTDSISIGTSGSTKMTILTGGEIGIGIITPDGTLHIHTGSSGSVAASTTADDLVIESNTHGGMTILTPDGSVAGLNFGSPTDNKGAYFSWRYSDLLFTLGSQVASAEVAFVSGSGVEAARFDSAGNLGIGISSLEAWDAAYTTIQMSATSSIAALTSALYIGENWYNDGSDKYTETSAASKYENIAGSHRFRVAASGTIDTVIPWTDMVRIDTTGVGIGTTAPGSLLDVSQATDGTTLRISSLQNDSAHSASVPYGKIEFYSGDASGGGAGPRAEIGCYNLGTFGSDGHLVFKTAPSASTVEVMRLTGIGNLGLGIDLPDGKCHIHTASAGSVTAAASFDDLVIENSTNVGMSLLAPDASFSSIAFGSPTDNNGALIQYQHSAALFTIGSQLAGGEVAFQSANNVEAMRIDGSQNVGIGEATPLHRLDVRVSATGAIPTDHQMGVANANDNYIGFMNESDTATYSGFALQTRTTSASRWLIANEWQAATQGDLVFRARDNATSNEIVRFTYDGKIGVGTTAPDGTLHIHTASAGSVTAGVDADNLIVENNGNGGISILTPDASTSNLYFGSPSDNIGARVRWNYSSNLMTIATANAGAELSIMSGGGVEAIRIASTQGVYTAGATGGDQGSGTINATGMYVNGVQMVGTSQWTDSGSDIYYTTGNVSIGTTSPDGTLHVMTASAGLVTAPASADDFIVENSTSGGITILVPDVSDATLNFGSPTDSSGAKINWKYSNDLFDMLTTTAGGEIALSTGSNVEAIRIDSSQNIGIGITTPDGRFHIYTASAGSVVAHASADELVLENSTNCGMSIFSPDGANSQVRFGSPTAAQGAQLSWNLSENKFVIGTKVAGTALAFETAGAVKATIDSDGNLGIGTQTPSKLLDIAGDGSTELIGLQITSDHDIAVASETSLRLGITNSTGVRYTKIQAYESAVNSNQVGLKFFTNSINGLDSEEVRMIITPAGDVGVGVTSLRADIGGAATRRFQIEGLTGAESGLSIVRNVVGTGGPALFFGKTRSATTGGSTIVQSGDDLGSILFVGADGTNLGTLAAGILAEVDGTTGVNIMPGRLVFSTTPAGSSTLSEAMRINALQNIGIGTTAPDGKVHIHTASAGSVTANVNGDDLIVENNGTGAGISILSPDSGFSQLIYGSPSDSNGASLQWNQSSGLLYLSTNVASGGEILFRSGNSIEAMRIDSSQQVGIGTTAPGSLLDVSQATDGTTLRISSLQNDSTHSASVPYGKIEFYSADASGGGAGAKAEIGAYPVGTTGSSSNLVFKAAAAASAVEVMRITAGGVGIGTTSPGAPLSVDTQGADANTPVIEILNDDGIIGQLRTSSAGDFVLRAATGGTQTMVFQNGTTPTMTLDVSNNVGIGVTPETDWNTAIAALQIGPTGVLYNYNVTDDAIHLGSNFRFNASNDFTYIQTNEATDYYQSAGTHVFRVAASGTADAVISWTEAMRIDINGNAGFGITPATDWSASYNALQIGNSAALFSNTGTNQVMLSSNYKVGNLGNEYITTATASRYMQSNGQHFFDVAPSGTADTAVSWTDGLYISNTGLVGLGTSSPDTLLTLSSNAPALSFEETGVTANNTKWDILANAEALNFRVVNDAYSAGVNWLTVDRTANTVDQIKLTATKTTIGTNVTPDGTLHVHTATAGSVTADGVAQDLVVENSGNAGISILSPNASSGLLVLGTPADSRGAQVQWDYTNLLMTVGSHIASGELRFNSGNSVEAMRIDSSQNVGIGTSSPDGTVHILTASAGSVTAHTNADDLVVENSGNAGISILVPSADTGSIYFGSPAFDVEASFSFSATGSLFNMGTHRSSGQLVFKSGGSGEAMRIDSSQRIIFGGTSIFVDDATWVSTTGIITIRRASGASQTNMTFVNNNSTVGSIVTSTTTTTYNISSDYRLKENDTPIYNASDIVMALKPREYNFKKTPEIKNTGFFAHELQEHIPQAVSGEKDDPDRMQGVDYSKVVAVLTASLQDALQRIAVLEAQ